MNLEDLEIDVKDHEYKKDNISREQMKVREQNRIRQLAFKVWQRMPRDYKSFRMVAQHLLKNTHRYKKGESSENEEILVAKKEENSELLKQELESPEKEKKSLNKVYSTTKY